METRRETVRPFASARYTGLLLGLALFIGLITYTGIGEVGRALAVAGGGLVVVALFHLLPIALDALGWRCVLPPHERPPVRTFVFARWIGFSVNSLLPVMQVGGNVVRARLLARHGVAGVRAAASVVVDVTTLVFSQVLFALVGLGLLVARLGAETPAAPVAAGIFIMALLVLGFYVVQQRGLFAGLTRGLERIVRVGDWLTASAEAIDRAVHALYGRRRAMAAATGWHLLSWIVGGGEVWLTLYLLGHPVSLVTALLVESLGHAVRSAAFAVPGALGVQEAGYLVLGRVVDLGPEISLALSLAQRVRDLILGLPGLVVWWLDGAVAVPRVARQRVGEPGGG
jgi:putative membrane protein